MQSPFSEEELALLDFKRIPRHVAIIMDGNRRWAKKQGLSRFSGHRRGAENLVEIVSAAACLKIKILTVYAFSTENWERPKSEVATLWRLFEEYLEKHEAEFQKNQVRLQAIGDLDNCPASFQKKLQHALALTANNQKITLVLAINYGGRNEILRSFQKMLAAYDQKLLKKEQLTEELLGGFLDTAGLEDPELLIRTSGEQRLSNFLLWQLSYSELYLTPTFWPAFSPKELLQALIIFQKRQRRFGGD
ncbi:MAG: polyprenyl diphosphate synthase [Parachlamydiales bacterium]|jgi:undecaprenyl diphosphate synthase